MKPQVILHFDWPPKDQTVMKECSIHVFGKLHKAFLNLTMFYYADGSLMEYACVSRHPGGLLKCRDIQKWEVEA
jgi:hypothetical protein